LSGEDRGKLPNEFENRFDLRDPVIFKVFTVLVPTAEFGRRSDNGGQGETHAISTGFKVSARGL